MKTHKNLYQEISNLGNIFLAWRKARKGKTKKPYVIEFEKNLIKNLLQLQDELKNQTYKPKPLETFILRDPKTRKISKSDFRDRIVHHLLIQIIEQIFDKTFIHDSCANRKNKGNLFAIKRFYSFTRKVSQNGKISPNEFKDNNYIIGFCFKADIKHYFQNINHKILLQIIKRKIKDKKIIKLIEKILINKGNKQIKGMPLGNLTSQFFANLYLNELDQFIKHKLKAKYYIRYVDDFIILHKSKYQLKIWKQQINFFLTQKLKLELHPDKTKIISLSKGIDFVGFRNFYHFKLLRKRNIRKMKSKIISLKKEKINYTQFIKIFNGWNAYAEQANSHNKTKEVLLTII
jgi:RNA-directed DNA polymerase